MAKHKPADPETTPPQGPLSPIQQRLEGLIAELSGLRHDEDEERFEDIVAELVNFGDTLQLRLGQMCRALDYQQRRAAVLALGRLGFPERTEVILFALEDANWKVRRAAARAVCENPFDEALDALLRLATDTHRELRLTSLSGLGKMGLAQAAPLLEQTLQDGDWRIRQEAAQSLGELGLPSSLGTLLQGIRDDDEDVRNACVESLQKIIAPIDDEDIRPSTEALDDKDRRKILEVLTKHSQADRVERLLLLLRHEVSSRVDLSELSRFGRIITEAHEQPDLDCAFEVEPLLHDILKQLSREGNNSVILVGEAGVGKTAVVHELTRRLMVKQPGCAVLETSTPELMVGTKYIGEWETKLRDLIDKIKKPRRVYLYLTNINDLPGAGTTSSNKQNFVTLLAPYIRRGDVTIIGESTPEALRRGIEKDLSIKRLFQTLKIEAPELGTLHKIVRQQLQFMATKADVQIQASSEVLEQLIDLSGTYYSTMAQPGRSVTVLRQAVDLALERHEQQEDPSVTLRLRSEDVIQGLARFTGLPELLLNDKIPLDTDTVHDFFQSRVLGQPKAVHAMVDLITMIKAGLTDPTKPFGVFLFVGPTGVGKTELAKAMAEFIFGSHERLLRFDLSEYRDYESFEKLIGGTRRLQEEGRLTGKVREQPFRVILLDEIEKAHPNIFDLFLQVFDDGRLTDSQGRVTDFRHTIIMMTSNLASAFSPGGTLGFGEDGTGGLASRTGVLREVQRFFRPEFVNRVDQTVVFNPLDKPVMAQIARRELGKALMRNGLLRRRLVANISPEVIEDLMSQGFSPAYGARPLKRAVESRVMLPVAREIVGRGPGYGAELLDITLNKEGKVQIQRTSLDQTSPPPKPTKAKLAALPGASERPALLLPPRSQTSATTHWKASTNLLDAFQAICSPQRLLGIITAMEKRMTQVTFWDDPAQARASLTQMAHTQRLYADLELLSEDHHNLRPGDTQDLRAWHGQHVDWLARLCDLERRRRDLRELDEPTTH